MLCGSLAGAISGYVGAVVAGTGIPLCNTLSIVTASTLNSGLTYLYTDGKTDFVVSMGVASYNFSKGEFGYLGKEGNSLMDNIGYTLGAITNLCDLYRLVTWDLLTMQERYNRLQKWAQRKYNEKNMSYVEYFKDREGNRVDIEGTYNWETDEIRIADPALSHDFGYAKSGYLHELNHRMDLTMHKTELNICKYLSGFDKYKKVAKSWHDQIFYRSDVNSYSFELNNASRFGLSLREYNLLYGKYLEYSTLSGTSVLIKNYSLWTYLKSVLLP